MTDHVRFDRHDGIVDIILNRPADGNLISQEMAEAMIGVLAEIAPDVKLIRLLAEGPDFCRGRQSPQIDRATATPLEVRRVVAQGPLDLYAAFKKTKAPVLGVVRGQATRGRLRARGVVRRHGRGRRRRVSRPRDGSRDRSDAGDVGARRPHPG